MQDNNSNFLMAVVLSLGVLLGWQFLLSNPVWPKSAPASLPQRKKSLPLPKTKALARHLKVSFAHRYIGAPLWRHGARAFHKARQQ